MDRSLDEIIGERPSRPRGGGRGRGGRGGRRPIDVDRPAPPPRAPRREEYPRDGVRKYRRDEPASLDSEWVHDRFEDDRYDRQRRAPAEDGRQAPRAPPSGGKLRIDNVHYELTEDDLSELFERVGPITKVSLQYDRHDRSTGTAWVIYEDERDARDALNRFDGCNANGQPIRMTLMPSAPAPRPLAERMERPPRSLFDRIESSREDSRDGGRRRRQRSNSPRNVDSYTPGGRPERSPIRRRATPRGGGRRPGERREERGGRGGRGGERERKPRVDEEGRPLVGGRPRKTAEELDAEMNDYWGSKDDTPAAESNGTPAANGGGNTAGADIDMDI